MEIRFRKGFTLIELVIVIVILGILAAIAIPKYISLQAEAQSAATEALAGNLASASAINYAANQVDNTKGVAVANCTDAASLLQGGLGTGYSIADNAIAGAEGTEAQCTLNGPNSTSATFTTIKTVL